MDDLVKHHPYLDENVRSKSIRFWNLTIPGGASPHPEVPIQASLHSTQVQYLNIISKHLTLVLVLLSILSK